MTEQVPSEEHCTCFGWGVYGGCPVHGNHPSNIIPRPEPDWCDNTQTTRSSDDE